MTCPHCQHDLNSAEVAKFLASLRKTNGGGPKPKPRCDCGKYTKDKANSMGHECQPIMLGVDSKH